MLNLCRVNKEKPVLKGVKIWGIHFAIESEENLKKYLISKIHSHQHLKIAPITMGELVKIFLLPKKKQLYQKLNFVYPDSWFFGRCLFMFNRSFKGEKKIYTHRLILDLIEEISKQRQPLTFVGLSENQKNNLQKKIKTLFSDISDTCFLNPEITSYQPEETVTLLNRSHYGLVIVGDKVRKLKTSLIERVQQGLLFFDSRHLHRYQKNWKKPPRSIFSRMLLLMAGVMKRRMFLLKFLIKAVTFYPLQLIFSLTFWVYVFVINKKSEDRSLVIN